MPVSSGEPPLVTPVPVGFPGATGARYAGVRARIVPDPGERRPFPGDLQTAGSSSRPSRLSMKELTEKTARPGPAGP
ncbi:hypothetical protein GA0115243_1115171 [Streptomyces sp. ScaeMP-e83]|nr:hypothetical protein GA0115243_1115171 [Streptomyces sp. ScaeMP-e83]